MDSNINGGKLMALIMFVFLEIYNLPLGRKKHAHDVRVLKELDKNKIN